MPLNSTATAVLGIFAVTVVVIFLLIIRHRILFAIAFRNMVRHRAQTAVVIGGLLIGSIVMSSAMVIGDSMNYSRTLDIYTELGELDQQVYPINSGSGDYLNMTVYHAYAGNESFSRYTDAIVPAIIEEPLAVVDINSNSMKKGSSLAGLSVETVNIIGVDTDEFRGMGDFKVDGRTYDGADISGFNVVINERLADDLNARKGDNLLVIYNSYSMASVGLSGLMGGYPGQNGSQGGAGNYTAPPGYNATGNDTQNSGMDIADLMNMTGLNRLVKNIQITVFTVAEVVDNTGKGNLFGDMNIYVPLETAQLMFNRTGEFNRLLISLKGGVRDSLKYNDDAQKAGEDILENLNLTNYARFDATKQKRQDNARESGSSFTGFLIMMSAFTIAASALLIVNLFIMLSEERKSELGIERAIGLKRSHLVLQFLFEGFLYSLVAAIIGTYIGIGVGQLMLNVFNNIFGSGGRSFVLYVVPSSLVVAGAGAFLLSMAVIVWASVKVSKLNIVLAIRSLEEPEEEHERASVKTGALLLVFGLLFVGLSLQASGISYATYFLLGPVLVLAGATLLLRKVIGPRASFTAMGLGIALYIVYFLIYGPEIEDDNGFILFVLQGILLVLAVVLMIMYNSDFTAGAVTSLARKSRTKAIIKPAMAYPLHKKFKSGMTVSMFSLVIFILVLFSIFTNLFQPDYEKESGGYEIWASYDGQISSFEDLERAQSGLVQLAAGLGDTGGINVTSILMNQTRDTHPEESIEYADFIWTANMVVDDVLINNFSYREEAARSYGRDIPFWYVELSGYDESFASHTKLRFKDKIPGYTDRELWKAVLEREDLIIVGGDYGQDYRGNPHHAGDKFVIRKTDNTTYEFTIAGILDTMFTTGVYMGKPALLNVSAPTPLTTGIRIKVKGGADPSEVNKKLEERYSIFGLNSVVFKELFLRIFQAIMDIFNMFQVYLGLGLIVGFASLGVVAMRSTIERRREIGMMRAVGFKKRDILATFLLESLFVTTLGVLIGTITGTLAAYGIYSQSMKDLGIDFTIPWQQIGILFAVVYAAAILATIYPALKASRVPVAEALRYYE